jgi:hypothetical protein
MGSKSSSSGGGNNNPSRPRKQLTDKPIYQDRIIRQDPKARSEVRTENEISRITKEQIQNPNRMEGRKDSKAIATSVAMKPGNFVTDRRGNPIRTSSGSIVMTSKGRKEYKQAMGRIPLSKAQFESQKKISNILSLPLMLVPGGGLIRAGMKNKQQNNVFQGGGNLSTYGGGRNNLTDAEANLIARQQQEVIQNRPMPEVNLKKRKRKSLLSTVTGGKLGSGGLL